jgi:hypothetical protein
LLKVALNTITLTLTSVTNRRIEIKESNLGLY